jgi:hypothetical protein
VVKDLIEGVDDANAEDAVKKPRPPSDKTFPPTTNPAMRNASSTVFSPLCRREDGQRRRLTFAPPSFNCRPSWPDSRLLIDCLPRAREAAGDAWAAGFPNGYRASITAAFGVFFLGYSVPALFAAAHHTSDL